MNSCRLGQRRGHRYGAKPHLGTKKPVAGPPTANALTNTIDWYYELPADTPLRARKRAAVVIPTTHSKQDALVIPFNAALHDIHGDRWV